MWKRLTRASHIVSGYPCRFNLTWIIIRVGAEQHAETRFIVDCLAGIVRLTCLEAVGEHQRAGYGVQHVGGGREDPPSDQLEADHLRVALIRSGGRARVVGAWDAGWFSGRGDDGSLVRGRDRPQQDRENS